MASTWEQTIARHAPVLQRGDTGDQVLHRRSALPQAEWHAGIIRGPSCGVCTTAAMLHLRHFVLLSVNLLERLVHVLVATHHREVAPYSLCPLGSLHQLHPSNLSRGFAGACSLKVSPADQHSS